MVKESIRGMELNENVQKVGNFRVIITTTAKMVLAIENIVIRISVYGIRNRN